MIKKKLNLYKLKFSSPLVKKIKAIIPKIVKRNAAMTWFKSIFSL